MSDYAYAYQHRGDGGPPIQHVMRKSEPDTTLCDEYIEPCDPEDEGAARCFGFHADTGRSDSKECPACTRLMQIETYEAARAEVARELDVDISEVF